ncbi:MAG: aspartate 1-decarboxylase [Deltaproteobacteria bacterium]|nr:aspartate 1-decarboxylase [Deltaproteobacteria bacterium]
MIRTMLKCKIHRATVTDAVLHYEGSITVDKTLMDAAGLVEYEQVHIWDVDNGNRFTTYVIDGEPGSGVICLNGAAARQVSKGDLVIIAAFAAYDEKELADYRPTLVYVDRNNRITSAKRKVESESRRPRVAAAP